jgi:ribosome biogenesis GTPase A
MPVATIIGAVIAAGAAIVGAAVNSSQVDTYNQMGMKLANQKRQDELNLQKKQDKITKWEMKQREKEFGFQRSEARKARKEREGEREYGKRQQSFANTMGLVNQNAQLRSVFMNTMTRR